MSKVQYEAKYLQAAYAFRSRYV